MWLKPIPSLQNVIKYRIENWPDNDRSELAWWNARNRQKEIIWQNLNGPQCWLNSNHFHLGSIYSFIHSFIQIDGVQSWYYHCLLRSCLSKYKRHVRLSTISNHYLLLISILFSKIYIYRIVRSKSSRTIKNDRCKKVSINYIISNMKGYNIINFKKKVTEASLKKR